MATTQVNKPTITAAEAAQQALAGFISQTIAYLAEGECTQVQLPDCTQVSRLQAVSDDPNWLSAYVVDGPYAGHTVQIPTGTSLIPIQ